MSTLSLVPPMINTADPDIKLIRQQGDPGRSTGPRARSRRSRAEGEDEDEARGRTADDRHRWLDRLEEHRVRRQRGRRPGLSLLTLAVVSRLRPGGLRPQPPASVVSRLSRRHRWLRCEARWRRASRPPLAEPFPRVYAVPRADRRVIAVVVTFNRLALLQGRARASRAGARAGRGARRRQRVHRRHGGVAGGVAGGLVRARTLTENGGGARGFHDGLEWAVERGADLVWLMDDDGLPDLDCLARLLLEERDLDFWGPLVVDEADLGPAGLPDPASGRDPGRARARRRPARGDGRPAGRHRHPVQRRAGDPRPRRSGSGCRAPSTSSGATTTSTGCAPRRPAPGSPPSSTPRSGTRPWAASAPR